VKEPEEAGGFTLLITLQKPGIVLVVDAVAAARINLVQ
jgi:hypothetical protein